MVSARGPVGVLALQGDFAAHRAMIERGGAQALEVRTSKQLAAVSGLVMPGGESTTMLKLMPADLAAALCCRIGEGMPVLATCAGLILLAEKVTHPTQRSLSVLPVTAERNSYGRQLDSFFTTQIEWTARGKTICSECSVPVSENGLLEGAFIRAPRIRAAAPSVEPLATYEGDPVAVKYNSIVAATFHPELVEGDSPLHQLFLRLCMQ